MLDGENLQLGTLHGEPSQSARVALGDDRCPPGTSNARHVATLAGLQTQRDLCLVWRESTDGRGGFASTNARRNHPALNSERGKPDCLMIPDNVPILNSPWSGTGTVMVVSSSSFCMIMWLPFRRTCSNPWLDKILQASLPDRTRNLGIL